jgi:dynactin complex subunit
MNNEHEIRISDDASTFTVTRTKEEVDLAKKLWLEKPNKHMNKDTDYHDRLEMEVSSLKRDNTRLQTKVTQLEYDLKRAYIQIHDLRLSNEQLRQTITERDEMMNDNTYETRLEDTIKGLKLDNEQLRQAIAVLNDEPTNSL